MNRTGGNPTLGLRGLALVGFVVAAAPSPAQDQDLTALAQTLRASVVVLEVNDAFGSPSGSGTGFFVSTDAMIATNYHVIEGAGTIVARTQDGRRYRVETVLAVDEENDLAVIRAEPGRYVPLPLGRSSEVKAGERVVVFGNPLGLDFTLSEGIVSAVRGRGELGDRELDVAHLQISAPISFGSSGSPVMNLAGEVVGVVSSGYVAAQNLNFAVPSELLRDLLTIATRNPDGEPISPTTSRARNLALSAGFFLALFVGYRYLLRGSSRGRR